MNKRFAVVAMRYAHKLCYRRMLRKLQKFGAVVVMTTVVIPDSERAVVEAELRDEADTDFARRLFEFTAGLDGAQ